MMAPFLLLLAGLQTISPAPATSVPMPIAPATAPSPPSDWSALPPLRYRRRPELPAAAGIFARDEVEAGRCPAPRGRPVLHVDLAVLLGPAGVARVVPRAMGCPTVEQFATGLVSRLARDNVVADGEGWHLTGLDLAWVG